jgi:beta-lactamase family protein
LHETARFNVGSVTKTFIAALVLALVEDGLLGLGDNATAHLPGRFERWRRRRSCAMSSRTASGSLHRGRHECRAGGAGCTIDVTLTPPRTAIESASLDITTPNPAEGTPGAALAGAGTPHSQAMKLFAGAGWQEVRLLPPDAPHASSAIYWAVAPARRDAEASVLAKGSLARILTPPGSGPLEERSDQEEEVSELTAA